MTIMRNFGGLPLVLGTLVCCRLMTDADALMVVSCGSSNGIARFPRALRMAAKGFGPPSSASEGKTKATRSSKAAGENTRSGGMDMVQKILRMHVYKPGPFQSSLILHVHRRHLCLPLTLNYFTFLRW